MDKVEVEKSRGSASDDGNGATEVREKYVNKKIKAKLLG